MTKIKLTSIIWTLVVVLLGLQVALGWQRATDGGHLARIEDHLTRLLLENSRLESHISQATSLDSLDRYAQTNGYVPARITSLGSIAVASLINQP